MNIIDELKFENTDEKFIDFIINKNDEYFQILIERCNNSKNGIVIPENQTIEEFLEFINKLA